MLKMYRYLLRTYFNLIPFPVTSKPTFFLCCLFSPAPHLKAASKTWPSIATQTLSSRSCRRLETTWSATWTKAPTCWVGGVAPTIMWLHCLLTVSLVIISSLSPPASESLFCAGCLALPSFQMSFLVCCNETHMSFATLFFFFVSISIIRYCLDTAPSLTVQSS